MNLFPIIGWLRLNPTLQVAARTVCLSRSLLLVIALELITMPVTQDLWSWDKFLHGGQDFELGMLIIVTCLCLTLLRTEQSRGELGLLVVIRALLLSKRTRSAALLPYCMELSEHRPRIPSTESFSLPLLI